jgi:hypothetical protein
MWRNELCSREEIAGHSISAGRLYSRDCKIVNRLVEVEVAMEQWQCFPPHTRGRTTLDLIRVDNPQISGDQ